MEFLDDTIKYAKKERKKILKSLRKEKMISFLSILLVLICIMYLIRNNIVLKVMLQILNDIDNEAEELIKKGEPYEQLFINFDKQYNYYKMVFFELTKWSYKSFTESRKGIKK